MDNFLKDLNHVSYGDGLLDFCRKRVLHGTPKIFHGKEGDFYEFRKRIAFNFKINFHEVFITGSAKLGFSPFKQKEWFEFFDSISHGKSEVGNYKVTAGVFKSYRYLEIYTLSGLESLKKALEVNETNAKSN